MKIPKLLLEKEVKKLKGKLVKKKEIKTFGDRLN